MKKPKMKTYRQGDVLVVAVDEIPKGLEEAPRARPAVLAYGEVTGHSHQIADRGKVRAFLRPGMPELHPEVSAFEVLEAVALLHEEHDPITLPPGRYRSVIQVESKFDWKEARRVAD